MSVKICSSRLTTCGVTPDGETVGLEFVDDSGTPVTVQLPFNQAEAVVNIRRALAVDSSYAPARQVLAALARPQGR